MMEFQDTLASWGAFFGFLGAAAATLLGLLFVAVSLRLNIFRDENVADVRDFAQLTLLGFLAPLVITGLTLMPHESPMGLAVPLLVLSAVGTAAMVGVAREWRRLNAVADPATPGPKPWQAPVWFYVSLVGLSYVALGGVAILVLTENDLALFVLAGVSGWMLLSGTLNAWIMLSNAQPGS